MKKRKKHTEPRKDEATAGAVEPSGDDAPKQTPPEAVAREQAEAPGPPTPEQEIASLQAERDALRDKLLRAQAECANISKRLRQQHAASLRLAGMGLARAILPVLDSLERTLGAIGDAAKEDPVAEGVRLIAEEMNKAFRDEGIVPIEAIGKPFDPTLHEAMMQDHASDLPPGTITREYQRGYTMHDRILRPAKVVVAAGKEGTAEGEDQASESRRGDAGHDDSETNAEAGAPDASSAKGEVSKR